jgi:hypothetical protein
VFLKFIKEDNVYIALALEYTNKVVLIPEKLYATSLASSLYFILSNVRFSNELNNPLL